MPPHRHAALALLVSLVGFVFFGTLTWLLLDAYAPTSWATGRGGSWLGRPQTGMELLVAGPVLGAVLSGVAWIGLVKAICPDCGEASCRGHAERKGLIYRCPCGGEVDVIND